MIDKFKGKRNTNGFNKNPENINKNGQPRKLFSTVNKELRDKGIEVLTKEQLIEAYGLIFNTDEEELVRIAKDKKYPYSLRLIIMSMNDKKTRDRAMADYRDYMFGKAVQPTNANVKIDNIELTEEKKKILNDLFKNNDIT